MIQFNPALIPGQIVAKVNEEGELIVVNFIIVFFFVSR